MAVQAKGIFSMTQQTLIRIIILEIFKSMLEENLKQWNINMWTIYHRFLFKMNVDETISISGSNILDIYASNFHRCLILSNGS